MNIMGAIAGALLVVLIPWDVFVVLVLTRRATQQFQFTRPLVILFRSLYAAVGRGA
jgi:hypothetical protein